MNNEKINSKIKLLNNFRYFNIRNFEILKYWSFYILSFQILTPTLTDSEFFCHVQVLKNVRGLKKSSSTRLYIACG